MANGGNMAGRAGAAGEKGAGEGGGIIAIFARHPNAANLLMVLMVLIGAFSVTRINTQFFPSIDRPQITVRVAWSGASAQDVEANVLAIIEPSVRYLSGIDRVTSTASEGSAVVQLQFIEGTDMAQAMTDVETAVKAISNLPEDAEDPAVSRAQFTDPVARLSVSGTAPENIKRDWAKRIRDDLIERGVDKIDFTGLRDPEIRVEVPEIELRRLGLTITDISRSVSANSRDLPAGNADGAVERQLRAIADAQNVRALSGVEVKSFAGGEKVLLGDIAAIGEGYDRDATRGIVGDFPAVELDIRRAPSADTLKIAAILSGYLDEIRPQLPPGIALSVYNDSSEALEARIWLLVKNGLSGLLVVIVILYLFLNSRIAFWVAAGIPVAMLATIGFMFVTGQTINMISLFALIMMLGVIVDDAIVVGEHTNTRLEMGDDALSAAQNGVRMMSTPVMAAMTTTLAAFAPILLIGDTIGQVMGVLPLVVIAVLVASLMECFFVLPGHLATALSARKPVAWSWWRQFTIAFVITIVIAGLSSRLAINLDGEGGVLSGAASWLLAQPMPLRMLLVAALALLVSSLIEYVLYRLAIRNRDRGGVGPQPGEGRFRAAFDRGFNRFRDGPFDRLVGLSWRWRYVTVSLAVGLVMVVAVGLVRAGKVEFVFFPSPEAETITGILTFNPGLPEDQALAAIAGHEAALHRIDGELAGADNSLIKATFISYGNSSRTGNTSARIRVQLTISEERSVRTPEIVAAWRKAVPEIAGVARFSIYQARGGPPGRDLEVRLQGERSAALKSAAADVIALLSGMNGVSGVDDDLPWGKPELVMELLPQGAALGFSIDEVGRQLRNGFDGVVPFRFARGDDEVTVRIVQRQRESGAAALRRFELRSPAGQFVPLTEVVRMTERQGFASIQRLNGKSTVAVTGDLDSEVITTDGAISRLKSGGELDLLASRHGVSYSFGGRSEEQKNAFADLKLGVMVALSVIYIILAWFLASYWRPVAVMLIIPLGIVGAIFGHWLLGFQLTILSLIGLLGLSGILVNDSIILVARLEERRAEGDDLAEAAMGASRDRLRAVLLTSLTTIGGLLPLLYEKSLQAQFLMPMVITIVFGLAFTTLLVLFLVPALVGIGDDIARTLAALYGNRTRARAAQG